MHLPATLANLLDRARSEARRSGHVQIEPIHVAAALLSANPDSFKQEFGRESGDKIRSLLEQMESSTGELLNAPETISLFENAARASDPARALKEELVKVISFLSQDRDFSMAKPTENKQKEKPDPGPAQKGAGLFIPKRVQRYLSVVTPDDKIIGREKVVDKLISLTGQHNPTTPCILGSRGSGRSALLRALAARLSDSDYSGPLAGLPVVLVHAEAVIAGERAGSLRQILEDIGDKAILVIDDVEVMATLGGTGADLDMLGVIRAAVGRRDMRTILVMGSSYFAKLETQDGELASLLEKMEIPALTESDLKHIAEMRIRTLAEFHKVTIEPDVLKKITTPAQQHCKRAHPALLTERLDKACVHAALRGDRTVTVKDFDMGHEVSKITEFDQDALLNHLKEHIQGNDQILKQITDRLCLTRARLDINPVRPDGVFMFAGPTGVGKTALARALCSGLYGNEESLIRIDMSEYAQEWALSRLIGPQPGYVGYTEPEGWLTTRVRKNPCSVLLLDEIEKAHPTVWNTFLQVFDAGRLTDARGAVANFSDCLIIMTSNLGYQAYQSNPIGFTNNDQTESQQKNVIEAIKQAMPPEFINRMDDVVVFSRLSFDVIKKIAQHEIKRTIKQLKEKGYELSIAQDVIEYLAESGYDPTYGARHLQRNIEKLLLQPLVKVERGQVAVKMKGGDIGFVRV